MANVIRAIQKILIIFLIVQCIFAFKNISQAGWWGDILSSADDFLEDGKKQAESGEIVVEEDGNGKKVTISTPSNIQLRETINKIYNILFTLGVAITVIVGGILGMKFMMASAEDKAKIKESLVPYIVGCIVIYGAFGIWKLAITIFSAVA